MGQEGMQIGPNVILNCVKIDEFRYGGPLSSPAGLAAVAAAATWLRPPARPAAP